MTITVYSKNNCQQCMATKRRLDKRGLAYSEVNVDNDEKALEFIKSKGFLSAPVVVLEDGTSWSGYRMDHIDNLAKELVAA